MLGLNHTWACLIHFVLIFIGKDISLIQPVSFCVTNRPEVILRLRRFSLSVHPEKTLIPISPFYLIPVREIKFYSRLYKWRQYDRVQYEGVNFLQAATVVAVKSTNWPFECTWTISCSIASQRLRRTPKNASHRCGELPQYHKCHATRPVTVFRAIILLLAD